MKTTITILLLLFSVNCYSQKIELDSTRTAYAYSRPPSELKHIIICSEIVSIFVYNQFIAQTERQANIAALVMFTVVPITYFICRNKLKLKPMKIFNDFPDVEISDRLQRRIDRYVNDMGRSGTILDCFMIFSGNCILVYKGLKYYLREEFDSKGTAIQTEYYKEYDSETKDLSELIRTIDY